MVIKGLIDPVGPNECVWVQFQALEMRVFLVGAGPIICESEFSGIGCRADVALGFTNSEAPHLVRRPTIPSIPAREFVVVETPL